MIKMLDEESLAAARRYCEDDPFGCRILGALLAYGLDKPFAQFWAQYDDKGNMTAVIDKLDVAMTVCAKGDYDAEEVDEFVSANVGYMGALRSVREGESASGLVMRLGGRKNRESSGEVELNPEISDLHAVLEECAGTGFEVPDFDSFYSDMIYRRKAKSVLTAVVRDEGLPAACGAMHLSDSTGVLVMCAAVPEHRGKGYTGQVINALLDRTAGRDIYLMCLPSLHGFYEKFGFVTVGGFVY
ncbi:MAG: GNAT family N-acetyltransferase [Clostridia bacterium]|nr:GNAT family N-acetyltransferase [Clostridia bacterium]